MGRLFDLVEAYRDRYAPHEPSYSKVAEQVGVSRQTLLNWRTPTKLLDKDHMVSLAKVLGVPWETVRDALLDDIGWKYEGQEVAARTVKRKSKADLAREAQDEAADSQ